MDWNHNQAAAIARIRATLSPDELAISEKVKRINDRYLGLTRDTAISLAFKNLVASVAWHDPQDENRPGKRRILAICGESGAGKTRAIMEHISLLAAMAPYIDEDGSEINPVLMYEPPSPCTPKLLAIEGLRKLGMPVRSNIRENEAWDKFRTALKAHKIIFVVIDEAQHAVVAANAVEQQKIADAFKGLVQMPDWPVRLILAGCLLSPSSFRSTSSCTLDALRSVSRSLRAKRELPQSTKFCRRSLPMVRFPSALKSMTSSRNA